MARGLSTRYLKAFCRDPAISSILDLTTKDQLLRLSTLPLHSYDYLLDFGCIPELRGAVDRARAQILLAGSEHLQGGPGPGGLRSIYLRLNLAPSLERGLGLLHRWRCVT